MPTTLLPVVCKGLVKNLTGYFNTYDHTLLPSSSILPSSSNSLSNQSQFSSIHSYTPSIIIPTNDDENDDTVQSNDHVNTIEYYRFSCRGYKRVFLYCFIIIFID